VCRYRCCLKENGKNCDVYFCSAKIVLLKVRFWLACADRQRGSGCLAIEESSVTVYR
jgi:hypothetical protein